MVKLVQSKIIKITDILIVLAFIMNLFALGMTNYLAVKKEPSVVLVEANPIQTNIINKDFKLHPEWKIVIGKLFKQVFIWTIIFYAYYLFRREFTFKKNLDCMVFIALFSFITFSIDFANDLGFFIGKLYGG